MMAMRARTAMRLSDLVDGLGVDCSRLAANPGITGLALDSRRVEIGDCFFALAGTREHGIRHAPAAIAAGAAAVLTEALDILPALDVPVLRVEHLRERVGDIAARFFGQPAQALRLIAVTGTNGKTTVAHLCADALRRLHGSSGYFGTLGSGRFGELGATLHTTPDPITLQRELAALVATGCRHVALEASSHALDQGRLNGVDIGVAVFTGLGHDHLDYHGTLEAYGAAKCRLFAHAGLATAIVNADDAYAPTVLAATTAGVRRWRYALHAQDVEFAAREIALTDTGSHIAVRTPNGEVHIDSALIGEFNASNLLAALAALMATGVPATDAAAALSAAPPVRGRMELAAREPRVYVDFAHSPDSLARVLAVLRPLCRGRLLCVFGCGGDRDASKRPLMGAVAEAGADVVVVTSDNPRSEDPATIASDILRGMARPHEARVELDRVAAIGDALRSANGDDIVLIAGKGHETTQIAGGVVTPLDDVQVVQTWLGRRA